MRLYQGGTAFYTRPLLLLSGTVFEFRMSQSQRVSKYNDGTYGCICLGRTMTTMMMDEQRLKRRTTTTAIAASSSMSSDTTTSSFPSNSSSTISIIDTLHTTNSHHTHDNDNDNDNNNNNNNDNNTSVRQQQLRRRRKRRTSHRTGPFSSVVSWLVRTWRQVQVPGPFTGSPVRRRPSSSSFSSSTKCMTMSHRWIQQILCAKKQGLCVVFGMGLLIWSLASSSSSVSDHNGNGSSRSLLRRTTTATTTANFQILFPSSSSSSARPRRPSRSTVVASSIALPQPRSIRAIKNGEEHTAQHDRHHEEKEAKADSESKEDDEDEETEEEGAASVVGADEPDYGTIQIGYTDYHSNHNDESRTTKTDTRQDILLPSNHPNPHTADGSGRVGRRREIFPDGSGRGRDGETPYRDYDKTPGYIDDENDAYYALDDDYIKGIDGIFNKKGRDDDDPDSEQYGHQCRRTAIHRQTQPNCNLVFELPYLTNHVFYINAGSYRQVFGLEHTYATPPIPPKQQQSEQMEEEEKNTKQGELIVVKEMYSSIAFQTGDYEFVRMDAMVAERLTASPRIYDIYGYCGTAIVSEYFPYGDYEAVAVPGSGYQMSDVLARADQHDANNNNTNDGTPPPPVLTTSYNEIAPPEKLRIALQMAEGLADLHGALDGTIVHQDVQLSQYLLSADNVTLKLNDFNRAEYMLWDEHKKQYCKYAEGHGNGNWRSPEEYYDNNLNEQVDVYSLGNNLYSILTGLWVFYDADNYANIAQRIQQGETAYINPVYLDPHTSPSRAEHHLATIITHCHEYNPQDRPSIFEVVDFLRKAVEEI